MNINMNNIKRQARMANADINVYKAMTAKRKNPIRIIQTILRALSI